MGKAMETVIAARDLTRSFGRKRVVDRLTLAVPRGAIYALLGDNGAGKSTTIRMLTGQLQPDEGNATILGQDCWAKGIELRHQVGYVPEKPRFYDWMTVEEIGGFAAGFHRDGYRKRYLELTERFGLERGVRLKTLSKGGYARVALVLALACEPAVLILDEPTSGLDLFTRRDFLSSMVELAGEGRTILLSTHAIVEVERIASHVAFISEGRILLEGDRESLQQRWLSLRIRHDGPAPELGGLGNVQQQQHSGQELEVAILDPDRSAIEDLRSQPGVRTVEEVPMPLEEMYTALLGKHHRGDVGAPLPERWQHQGIKHKDDRS